MSARPTTRRTVVLAGLAAPLAVAVPARAQESLPLTRPSLAERVKSTGVPALGYAVVGPDGVRALEVSGVRRADRNIAFAPNDPWHLGGLTQPLTAALYARLAEQGVVSWATRVTDLFPDVSADPAWREVRIEALLSHRGGLSDRTSLTTERLRAMRIDGRPIAEQRAAFAAELLAKPPPGQIDAYEPSLAGYALAGAAIERATKTDWETAITVGLFRPLKLDNAAFGPPQADAGDVAPCGHDLQRGGRLTPVDPTALADYPPLLGPAGRVHMPLGDLAKVSRLFLAEGAGVLRTESLARLARPWGGLREGGAMGWDTADRPWADGPVMTAEGSDGLWRATALIAPAKGLAVLTACNADAGGGAEAARALSLALVALYTNPAVPQPRPRRRWLIF